MEISDMLNLVGYFHNPENYTIKGSLNIKFSAKNIKSGTGKTELTEIFVFNENWFTIKSNSRENYFDKPKINNEFCNADDKTTEQFIQKIFLDTMHSVF